MLRLMFHPEGLRPFVSNWDAVAEALLRRVHREVVGGVKDQATCELLDEILGYLGVPDSIGRNAGSTGSPSLPIIPVGFRRAGREYEFFSTITTLGTPLVSGP